MGGTINYTQIFTFHKLHIFMFSESSGLRVVAHKSFTILEHSHYTIKTCNISIHSHFDVSYDPHNFNGTHPGHNQPLTFLTHFGT